MSQQPQYRSKLVSSRNVTQGLGSAVPANQRLAGAPNPEAAALLAGMDPAEAEKRSSKLQERAAEVEDKKRDILWASENEGYILSGGIESASSDDILSKHDELVEWRNSRIDEETNQMVDENLPMSPMDVEDPLYNPVSDIGRKNAIEKDLKPLDFESMVFNGHCDQEIEIRENFSIQFRTISTLHGMWLEMFLTDLSEYSVQYGRHWFSLCQVAVSLQTVNGKSIGPSLMNFTETAQKDDFKKTVEARMKFLNRLPGLVTDDLIVQFVWFNGRVRRLLSGDVTRKVGNS